MDIAWLAPPIVLLVGALSMAVLLRRIVVAGEELRSATRSFRRLEHGLIPVRVESRRTRRAADRFDRR